MKKHIMVKGPMTTQIEKTSICDTCPAKDICGKYEAVKPIVLTSCPNRK